MSKLKISCCQNTQADVQYKQVGYLANDPIIPSSPHSVLKTTQKLCCKRVAELSQQRGHPIKRMLCQKQQQQKTLQDLNPKTLGSHDRLPLG